MQQDYSIRDLTLNLDNFFANDFKEIQKKTTQTQIDQELTRYETQLLKEWDIYKSSRLIKIGNDSIQKECIKICLCEFKQSRQTTMEFWIKVAFDLMSHDKIGKLTKDKLLKCFQHKQEYLIADLINKKWPQCWNNITEDSCLNLEIIKLYLEYIPLRIFLADNIKQRTNILINIKRMPFLQENYIMKLMVREDIFLPSLKFSGPYLLEQISNSGNVFCNKISSFIKNISPFILPILDLMNCSKNEGKTINIYGTQFKFIYKLLLSLKVIGARKIENTKQSIRSDKKFKQIKKYKQKNLKNEIIITMLEQKDIKYHVLLDIKENFKKGYVVHVSDIDECDQAIKRLIIIFSSQKLSFGSLDPKINQYKLPDEQISEILNRVEYHFLEYFTNMLFNYHELEKRAHGIRQKYSQIMICMWSYVLAQYFLKNPDTLITNNKNDSQNEVSKNSEQTEDLEIQFTDDSSSDDSEIILPINSQKPINLSNK